METPSIDLVQLEGWQEVSSALTSREDFRVAFLDTSLFGLDRFDELTRATGVENSVAVVAVGPENLELQALEAGAHEYVAYDKLRLSGLLRAKQLALRRRARETRLLAQMLQDELTGLPLRALFMDRLKTVLRASARDHGPCALFFIDVDNFKQVNDSLGHGVGDALLKEVGARLTCSVRAGDTVARLGGDEFAVLTPGVASKAGAERIARTLLDAMALPIFAGQQEVLQVSLSIGGVWLPSASLPAAELLHQADMAMYEAKFAGKGQVCMK